MRHLRDGARTLWFCISEDPANYPLMLGLLLAVTIAFSTGAALLSGISVVPIAFGGVCVLMMWHNLRDSHDILDPRAGFFLGAFLFIALPDLIVATDFGRFGQLYRVQTIPQLVIERADFERAQAIVAVGMLAVVSAFICAPAIGTPSGEEDEPRTNRNTWVIYSVAVSVAIAVAMIQYGTLANVLLSIVDPVSRISDVTHQESGLTGLLTLLTCVSAYYIIRRSGKRWLAIPLFIPPIALTLPLANRGSLLEISLIAWLAIGQLRFRRPFSVMVAGSLFLPPLAGGLLLLRNSALGFAGDVSLGGLYRGFANESVAIPTLAFALEGIRSGLIRFTYGLDLLLFPVAFVPRLLWPGKPMPLDFRLNAALGLNDGTPFGTPVGIFGGFFLNFTWLAYVPAIFAFAIVLVWTARRVRRDRLVLLLVFVFTIDIVRVGDISRELLTL